MLLKEKVSLLLLGWVSVGMLVSASPARIPVHLAQQARLPDNRIQYDVAPELTGSPRLLNITMRFRVSGHPQHVAVQMPVWSPGDYHIQNHARFVQDLHAFEAGSEGTARELEVMHPDA